MTLLARPVPDRVDRLVYLDAIFDYSIPAYKAAIKVFEAVPNPQPTNTDLVNMDAFRRFNQLALFGGNPALPFWSDALEAEMRDGVRVL